MTDAASPDFSRPRFSAITKRLRTSNQNNEGARAGLPLEPGHDLVRGVILLVRKEPGCCDGGVDDYLHVKRADLRRAKRESRRPSSWADWLAPL